MKMPKGGASLEVDMAELQPFTGELDPAPTTALRPFTGELDPVQPAGQASPQASTFAAPPLTLFSVRTPAQSPREAVPPQHYAACDERRQ